MKKIICTLLIVLFSLYSSLSFASATTFRAEGADLSITLPDSMYVFDRKVSPTDDRITALGLTYEGLIASFVSQDIYLDALDTEAFNEILVISEPTQDKNFYDLTSGELYNAVLSEEKSLTESGRTIENADIFELGEVDFVKTISKANDTYMQYTTVYNGKKIKIRLIDFDGNITNDEAESFEEIIETITFDTPTKASLSENNPDKDAEADTDVTSDTQKADNQEMSDATTMASKSEKVPYGSLGKIALIIGIAILICSIPALIFRYVFTSGGIRQKGAKVFAFFYTIFMTALFYYIVTKHQELNLSLLICLVPVIWSFVIYKIVKR